MTVTLVDAGPLVAVLDRSDPHHGRCREALRRIPAPLLTVWPVLTEAMYLLRGSWTAQRELLGWAAGGALGLLALAEDDVPRIRDLMEKYRDLPMDLADAALGERRGARAHCRRVDAGSSRFLSLPPGRDWTVPAHPMTARQQRPA